MRYKTRWHPCFLPTNFRERVKQYQAEIDRDTDVRETMSDEQGMMNYRRNDER